MNSSEDITHLQLLSIFHYVLAGMLALFSMFPILHLIIGIAIVTGQFDQGETSQSPPAFFGWLFIIIPAAMILFGLLLAVAVAISGRRLAQLRHYNYCLIVAAVMCIFMPVGTALGIFSLIVLMRPSVRTLFGVDPKDDLLQKG